MGEKTKLVVPPEDAGQRVDRWLSDRLGDLSRSRIQALLTSGDITLGAAHVKAHQKLAAGAEILITIPDNRPAEVCAEDIPLQIMYEDANIVVVNKPPGMVVHPAVGHHSGTLVNALLYHCGELPEVGGKIRPGIVHRLDKNTSGVLVVARNDKAMAGLAKQFKNRTVRKEYLAVVWGRMQPCSGTVEIPVGRNVHDRKKMAVRPVSGRIAITHYETEKAFADMSLLRLRLETGRTHQIRVHMAHLRHPVVGDQKYGRKGGKNTPVPVPRQMLHADKLVLDLPVSDKRVEFVAPLPDDMKALIEALRVEGEMMNDE